MSRPVSLVCEGCGAVPPPLEEAPYPFRCAHAGLDAMDHLLAPKLDAICAVWPVEPGDRPFVRYRRLLFAHAAAIQLGLGDDGYLAIANRLETDVASIDGRSFRTTPLGPAAALAEAIGAHGEVWIKDETRNVSGSHKGRHLFGVLLYLEIVRAAGLEPSPPPPLAIASCGNAALAAGILATAADRPLVVMVPPDAHPRVLARLRDLGADVRIHERAPGELGDPTLAAFRHAVAAGAIPFACQGTECGLALDGGRTLGFELAASWVPFNRAFVQVGGGALMSSLARGLDDARALGALARMPRLMAVQTEAVAPLARAYRTLVDDVRRRLPTESLPIEPGDALADQLRSPRIAPAARSVLAEMAQDRRAWLPPWDAPHPSRAYGILDDETYDALAILRAMIATGGSPVVVDEATVAEAEQLGRDRTGIDADATATAGLAGLLTWNRHHPQDGRERTLLLFTGARR
jgi:threonine synthase